MPHHRTEGRHQTSAEKSSMIRQCGCCCMRLLYKPNSGCQINPLQLEQMMMSSFSLISIKHATGSLLHEYPYTLRLFHPRQVSSTGKQTDAPVVHTNGDAPGRL
jgi:hypothetical protein